MQAYVFDTIRASLCDLSLDQAFESKEEIALSLKRHLAEVMASYGISIVTALVTDVSPDIKVIPNMIIFSEQTHQFNTCLFNIYKKTNSLLTGA